MRALGTGRETVYTPSSSIKNYFSIIRVKELSRPVVDKKCALTVLVHDEIWTGRLDML